MASQASRIPFIGLLGATGMTPAVRNRNRRNGFLANPANATNRIGRGEAICNTTAST
jgi:hypothetical protein